MPPLWTPYAHKIQHTFDTSRCTALPSDRPLPLVHSPSRTAYTDQNIGGISDRETVTPEACSQQRSRTSVHNPRISECAQVRHDVHRASNMPYGLDAQSMAVLAELNAFLHLVVRVMFSLCPRLGPTLGRGIQIWQHHERSTSGEQRRAGR